MPRFFSMASSWNTHGPIKAQGSRQVEAAEFFSENPPRVWFADGASLDGNAHTPLKTDDR